MLQWNDRLSQALRTDSGRPAVTWYARDGERIELSRATLDNWATKTANLLIDDADASPGTQIALEIPLHWRTVCWALGIWRTGACIVTTPVTSTVTPVAPSKTPASAAPPPAATMPPGPRVLVTTNPTAGADVDLQIAVALPPLARCFDGPLHGALDSAATVGAQPDWLGPVVPPEACDLALADGTTTVSYEKFTTRPPGAPRRVLRTADPTAPVRLADLLALDVLADGGSLVLVTTDHPAAPQGSARDHLVATERITHT
ncbi:MAG: TIGR03089 family protein [Micrococcales bacterium]|nr:TIGR03089 family protein [Micrococcales bacterium]MCL2669012.1 TIGR03089 family protein [Micrococcales bacterium]